MLAQRLRAFSVLGAVALIAVVALAVSATGFLGHGGQDAPDSVPPHSTGTGQWTGLQWRDVTGSAGDFFRHRSPPVQGGDLAGIVFWRDGVAMVGGGDRTVWTSHDGLTWTKSPGAPRYAGLVSWNGMLVAGGIGGDQAVSGLWTSSDAIVWHQAPIHFDTRGCQQRGACSGLATGALGILAVATEGRLSVIDPGVPYLSTDGVHWSASPVPEEASEVTVCHLYDGFLAYGFVPESADHPFDLIGRSWQSSDGLQWSLYEPTVPSPVEGLRPWDAVHPCGDQYGPLGGDNGALRSSDGETWALDTETPAGAELVSDGGRIVAVQIWLSRFYLSEGDGHWRELEQGGGIGQLPAGGRAYLLPNGLLWATEGRVFFGQALSGVRPSGSLVPWTPSPTPWPGPS